MYISYVAQVDPTFCKLNIPTFEVAQVAFSCQFTQLQRFAQLPVSVFDSEPPLQIQRLTARWLGMLATLKDTDLTLRSRRFRDIHLNRQATTLSHFDDVITWLNGFHVHATTTVFEYVVPKIETQTPALQILIATNANEWQVWITSWHRKLISARECAHFASLMTQSFESGQQPKHGEILIEIYTRSC